MNRIALEWLTAGVEAEAVQGHVIWSNPKAGKSYRPGIGVRPRDVCMPE